MRKWFTVFLSVIVFGGLTLMPSCKVEEPTSGILVITVMDSYGNLVTGEQVYIATSYQNLQTGHYYARGWTDELGEVLFMDLPPVYFWYDTEHWEDYGATQVYVGFEHYVILWVNTPQP